MSTFKVQPIYAELLMGWLDVAHQEKSVFDVKEVLESVAWRFKGGLMGAYPMEYPTESSETRFADGEATMLASMSEVEPDRRALAAVLNNRREDRRVTARAAADWSTSYILMQIGRMNSSNYDPARTGLSAVYLCLLDIWDAGAPAKGSADLLRLERYIRECTIASAAASMHHVATTDQIVRSTFAALRPTKLDSLRQALAEFKRLLRYTGSRQARQNSVRTGRMIISGDIDTRTDLYSDVLAARFTVAGRAYYAVHGCAVTNIGSRTHILSRSDLVRVHQFLVGAQSGLFATVSQACVAPGPERLRAMEIAHAYERQVDRLLRTAVRVPMGDEVSVCKAYKRAFGAYLGELSGPICGPETTALWEEARSTKHAGMLELDAWVGEIRSWSASTAFNLGKVYKLCPAPDASPGLTLIERHEMVCNHNTPDPEILGEFEAELRSQILRAYIRQPGVKLTARDPAALPVWYSAYRAGRLDEVPSSEIHRFLAWEGTGQMPVRSRDDPSVWKDSGLGWDDFDLATDPARPRRSGNMLMRMIFDKTCPMPGVRHMGHSHDHKVDIKPEGHKDPARGIYSGNIRDRLNQSWMEMAVQQVARHHPSFMIGADTEARDARVRAITARDHDMSQRTFYYSFDISGWSPRMPPQPQHISHLIWADLYGEELFSNAATITDGSLVYMNKNGVRGWFRNPGANFEGYNGKEMTMILISLMSLTVRRWRAKAIESGLATKSEVTQWAAILLAYIDDGLARLDLPHTKYHELTRLFKDTTVDTFGKCGYSIEPSKCYPSDRFAIFLNEPYLAGRHITHGTRAAMTICAENTEEHTSIVERLTAVSTGCRGAVMAGLDATAGIMLQAYHTLAHIDEWLRRPDAVTAAVWSYTPRAWGGLGLPNALQLGTSGSGSAFEESVRTLQKWAHCSITAKRVFLIRCKSPLATRTATGVLMAPLGGRTKNGTLVESRVPDAVRSALAMLAKNGELSPLARDFLGYASPESLDAFSAALVPLSASTVLQEQLLSDLASAHPHALFSSFARRIEKSSTLMSLVGHKEMRRIIRANRDDATNSYQVLKSLLLI